MDSGTAIFIGAILATVGWLYGGRQQRLTSRRQHTYQIILKQQDDKRYEEALDKLRLLLASNSVPAASNTHRKDDQDHIDHLLNYYEFLAAAVWCGDIDENLIRLCEETRIKNLITRLTNYIEDNRRVLSQPTLWANLEDLASRWSRRRHPPSHHIYEIYTQKPCRREPRWLTSIDTSARSLQLEYRSARCAFRSKRPLSESYRRAKRRLVLRAGNRSGK